VKHLRKSIVKGKFSQPIIIFICDKIPNYNLRVFDNYQEKEQ
jgi:hypothetical protein